MREERLTGEDKYSSGAHNAYINDSRSVKHRAILYALLAPASIAPMGHPWPEISPHGLAPDSCQRAVYPKGTNAWSEDLWPCRQLLFPQHVALAAYASRSSPKRYVF